MPTLDNWVIPDNIDITNFDFSWEPNPNDPPYIYEFATQWQKTGAAYEDLAKSPELKDAITNLNKTLIAMQGSLVQLNKTLATVDKQADTNGESLQVALKRTQEAMKQFSATALTIKQFIDTQQNLGTDSHRALTQLSEAAESVQRLADYLERNPSAILSGRATTKP